MNFVLRIKSVDGAPVKIDRRHGGFDLVLRAMEVLDLGRLDATVVDEYVPDYCLWFVDLDIPQATAAQSGCFKDSTRAEILVPPESLNRFVHQVVISSYIPEMQKYDAIGWSWYLDRATILWEWENAGFPKEWDPWAQSGD